MVANDGTGARGRRLVFMGSPGFALPCLQALLEDGWDVPLVLSQPDRPAGRGRGSRPTEISAFARERGLALETPVDLEDPGLHERLKAVDAPWFVVVAYRLLPASVLALPGRGAVNLHASLLPDFRGAAPIQRAIMAGCSRSGLSTFLLSPGVDTGPLLMQKEIEIGPDETGGQLHDRMMHAGAQLLRATMDGLDAGTLAGQPQAQRDGLRRAPKLGPRTRRLDFSRPVQSLHDRIRALAPAPGAQCQFRGRRLQILATRRTDETVPQGCLPGELVLLANGGLAIVCGDGLLECLLLKPEGKGPQEASAWLNGARPLPGERLLPVE